MSTPASFAHLHLHTEYSMLDGAARIEQVVRAAAADGQPAIAITDHGNMYGVLDFYKVCKEVGIKPIVGMEAYMAPESRFDRTPRSADTSTGELNKRPYYHLTLLAETTAGYHNLMQLSSKSYLEGYFYKSRADWDLLAEHSAGLIATTGCLGGLVLQALMQDNESLALQYASRLQDIYGKDNLFVELQDHGMADQRRTNPMLVELARKIGAPLLATNDSHYTTHDDHTAHDALLCIQTASTIDDPKRFKFESDQHYLKSSAEMRSLFSEYPEACDNTLWIAERANVEIEFGHPKLPQFPLPEGFTTDTDYLRRLTLDGAAKRYGTAVDGLPGVVSERVDYELGVIADMGFSAYFLVVWDLIRFAKHEAHIRVGPGRGSAAGSLVAYALEITDLDPIKYDLLFERFLNPGRKQMPDIDMDFDDQRRGEMIKYAAQKYGWDHVAQIVTFSTIKARAAVRDASRVLGYEYGVGDRIAKLIPPLMMGRDTPLHACLDLQPKYEEGYKMASELRELYKSDPESRRVMDVAKGLEGLRRQDGIHAAAVVITDSPLTDYLPIQRKPAQGEDPADAPIVTQYEMHGVESLGLLKMDFLGLTTLSIIERALSQINAGMKTHFDIDTIDLADDLTLAMLRRGDSMGVFQLEGGPMRSLMRQLAPTSFDDIAALVALYRPGPMAANMHTDYADRKNGRQAVTYLHPDMADVLGDTYGLCIFQESVMRLAQKFAGYTLAEADNLRKAAGKKSRDVMAKERVKFVSGAAQTGYGEAIGSALFDIIEPFADYAFNKSHSYGYGLVAYQTAYLKAHYPTEYMAALLTGVKDSQEKTAVYLSECRRLGITVLVPDVNASEANFVARNGGAETIGEIPFGLGGIRNVGDGLVAKIVEERRNGGDYSDFYDFCQRVDATVLNKRSVESLIKAGAFDSLEHSRRGLLSCYERIIDSTLARRREEQAGLMSLFGSTGDGGFEDARVEIPTDEFDQPLILKFEQEVLGRYVSSHPLLGVSKALAKVADCTIAQWTEEANGGEIKTVAGLITGLNRRTTKNGQQMASFVLEDLDSAIDCMVFPRTMHQVGHLLTDGNIVCVKARYDDNETPAKLVVVDITTPELKPSQSILRLTLPTDNLRDNLVDDLKALIGAHPGNGEIHIVVGRHQITLDDDSTVDGSAQFLASLEHLFEGRAVIEWFVDGDTRAAG